MPMHKRTLLVKCSALVYPSLGTRTHPQVDEATKRGIPVGNTPGVLTETTAELAAALTLSAARRVVEADSFMRGGHYKGWLPDLFVGKLLQVRGVGCGCIHTTERVHGQRSTTANASSWLLMVGRSIMHIDTVCGSIVCDTCPVCTQQGMSICTFVDKK